MDRSAHPSDSDRSLFNPFDPDTSLAITYGSHLPHWEQIGATYFVTWRTLDSMPGAVIDAWLEDRNKWLAQNNLEVSKLKEWPEDKKTRYHVSFSNRWLNELDQCHGECVLRRQDLKKIVYDSILSFQDERYEIHDFVIMPNHVHVLFTPLSDHPVREICKSWKKFTAGQINRALSRNGKFWQKESFDHLVRSERSFGAFSRYIRENPTVANLREGNYWLWQK